MQVLGGNGAWSTPAAGGFGPSAQQQREMQSGQRAAIEVAQQRGKKEASFKKGAYVTRPGVMPPPPDKPQSSSGASGRASATVMVLFLRNLKTASLDNVTKMYRAARDGQPYAGYPGTFMRSVFDAVKKELVSRKAAISPDSGTTKPPSWTVRPPLSTQPSMQPPSVVSAPSQPVLPPPPASQPPVPYQAPAAIPTAPTLPSPPASSGGGGGGGGGGSASDAGISVPSASPETVEASASEAGMISQEPTTLPGDQPPPVVMAKKSKVPAVAAVAVVALAAFGIWKWKFAKK